MNTLKFSQKIFLFLVFILGLVLTVLLVRQQQDLRERAAQTDSSAVAVCSADGKVNINVSFTNTSTSIVNVLAKDIQSGIETAIGTANPGDTVSGVIETGLQSVSQNIVTFETSNGETKTAAYTALDCVGTIRACAVNQAKCTWDALDNATQYKVKITNSDSGDLVKEGIVNHPTTSFVFPAEPGNKYSCEVIPVNSCGIGEKATAEDTCPLPTPTGLPPTSTPVLSVTPETSVTPSTTVSPSTTPIQSVTPNPSSTPVPTNTPQPTNGMQSSPTLRADKSPTPAITTASPTKSAAVPTPTSISALPPTGFTQDILTITIVGSSIVLLGAFVLIFLW